MFVFNRVYALRYYSLTLVIPGSLLIKRLLLSKKIKERKIIIMLTMLSLILCILLIDNIIPSIYSFCSLFTALLIVTNFCESFASFLLVMIIPSEWSLWGLNSGLLITISITLGKILGSLLLTISLLIGGIANLLVISYGFCAVLFFGIIIALAFNYSELRVKAMARILKSRNNLYNNIK